MPTIYQQPAPVQQPLWTSLRVMLWLVVLQSGLLLLKLVSQTQIPSRTKIRG